MSCVPGAPIPHSLPGPAYTVFHTISPPTLSTPLANYFLSSTVPNTATLGPLTGIALLPLAQPFLPTTAANVYMLLPPAPNALPSPSHTSFCPFSTSPSLTFPHPLPPTHRPYPTLDGTDLIERVFNGPDLGLCRACHRGGATPSFVTWRGQPRPNRPPTPSQLGPHPAIYLAGWGHAHLLRHKGGGVGPNPGSTRPLPTHTCIITPTLYTTPHTPSAPTTTPQPPPSSLPLLRFGSHHRLPRVLPCSRRLKPRRGRVAALLLLRYSRAAWQGVDAC
jgi:hypothetical protein